jgi:site-specific DNA-methyltransferase (adenine-specific)
VTGNNKKFARATPALGYIPVFKGSEIFRDRLEGPSTYIPDDLSLYQQVAPKNIYTAKEKLIYRFISSKLVFFHDTEQRFVLNSANVVVPNKNFPVAMSILSHYLSSDFVNWFFGAVFSTHKILRADIESIPIFVDCLRQMTFFDEDELLRTLRLRRSNGRYRIA